MASRGPGVLSQGTIDNFFRGKSTKPFLNDPRPEVHSLEGSCDLGKSLKQNFHHTSAVVLRTLLEYQT